MLRHPEETQYMMFESNVTRLKPSCVFDTWDNPNEYLPITYCSFISQTPEMDETTSSEVGTPQTRQENNTLEMSWSFFLHLTNS